MAERPVDAEMPVWEVYRRHPKTIDVFLGYGCPDIRRGAFPLIMRLVKVRWAARMHRVPVEDMLRDLNAVTDAHQRHGR